MMHTHKQQSLDKASQMAARNAARVAIAKRVLGEKYLCHPAQHVTRKDAETRPVSDAKFYLGLPALLVEQATIFG